MHWTRPPFEISDEPARLDRAAIHAALAASYWATGIPREVMDRALENSLSLGLYHAADQIGLARAVTDRATYAYLCDVYVLEPWRGRGLGTWLIDCLLSHPDLQGLRRLQLVTRDAHPLYQRFGFVPASNPGSHLEKRDPDVYKRPSGDRISSP